MPLGFEASARDIFAAVLLDFRFLFSMSAYNGFHYSQFASHGRVIWGERGRRHRQHLHQQERKQARLLVARRRVLALTLSFIIF